MGDILDEIWKVRNPKDALFLSIIEGYIIQKYDDYPDVYLFIKGDKILIEYNSLSKITRINYNSLWLVFSTRFKLNYSETIEKMKYMLETHLNLKDTLPDFSDDNIFEINKKLIKPKLITIRNQRMFG